MSAAVEIDVLLEGEEAIAEAKRIDASIDRIGKRSGSAAQVASRSFSGFDKAARSASGGVAQLDGAALKLAQDWGVVSRASEGASKAVKTNSDATRGAGDALDAIAPKVDKVAKGKKEVAESSEKAASGFSKVTNQVRTSGTILEGYDALLTAIVGSTGGVTVGTAVLISVLGSLAAVIVQSIGASKEKIEIDQQMVSVDALRAKTTGDVLRFNADLVVSFQTLAGEQKAYSTNTASLTAVTNLMTQRFEAYNAVSAQTGQRIEALDIGANKFRGRIIELRDEIDKQEKTMQPALETLRKAREIYGLNTDQLIAYAQRLGFTTQQQGFFRQQLDSDLPRLRELAKVVEENANKMFKWERAALNLSIALNQIRIPQISIEGVQGLPGALGALNRGVALLEGQGITDPRRKLEGLRSEVSGFVDMLKRQSAQLGQNEADTRRMFEQDLRFYKEMFPQIGRLIDLHFKEQEQLKAFADTGRQAGREAEQLRRTEFQLERELIQAQTQLHKESFDKRIELVRDEYKVRRQELIANKQATATTLDALNVLEAIHIQAIRNEQLKLQEEEGRDRVKRLIEQREFRERELQDYRTFLVKQRQVREDMEREDRLKRDKEDLERRSNRPGRAETQADEIARQSAQLQRYHRILGGVVNETGNYSVELAKIEAFRRGDTFGAMATQLQDIQQQFLSLGAITNFVGSAIAGAFEAAVSGADSFGKSLTKAVLMFIAQIAQSFGQLFLTTGAGLLILGWPGGGALIGYGIALMALAGVLRGLASRIDDSHERSQRDALQSQGASAVGSGSSPARREPQPVVVDIGGASRFGSQSAVLAQNQSLNSANDARIRLLDQRIAKIERLERSAFYRGLGMGQLRDEAAAERARLLNSRGIPVIGSGANGRSSGVPIIVNLRFNEKTGKALLKGEQVVTMDNLKGEFNEPAKKALGLRKTG